MSATEAKEIRTALKKELGLNSKQVSVRARCYPLGSSVYVSIKSTDADYTKVDPKTKCSDHVRYCEDTPEILGSFGRAVHGFSEEARTRG